MVLPHVSGKCGIITGINISLKIYSVMFHPLLSASPIHDGCSVCVMFPIHAVSSISWLCCFSVGKHFRYVCCLCGSYPFDFPSVLLSSLPLCLVSCVSGVVPWCNLSSCLVALDCNMQMIFSPAAGLVGASWDLVRLRSLCAVL